MKARLKTYHDKYYGDITIIPNEKFESKIYPEHENCDMNSDTVLHNKKFHIERLICKTHQMDWFVDIDDNLFKKQEEKSDSLKTIEFLLKLMNLPYETKADIYGEPDIFIEPDVCIFIDNCKSVGCIECYPKNHNNTRPLTNLVRDARVNSELNHLGYKVIRIKEHDITENVKEVGDRIIDLILSSVGES